MTAMLDHKKLYFDGDMEAAVALSGQIAGRIEEIRPVADIIRECADDCVAVLSQLHRLYVD
jgi:enoyl-[acyl-carrier protein] reductase II